MAQKKTSRAERKAEEARVIAEMDEAMKNLRAEQSAGESDKNEKPQQAPAKEAGKEPKTGKAPGAGAGASMSGQMHCRKCGTVMENGVCPKCGYKVYVPMDEKKMRRIRWIVGGVCLVGLLIWLLVTRLAK